MEFAFGFFFLLVLTVGVAGLILWIWALVQVIKRPNDSDYVNGNQLIWLLCLVLLNLLGAILYLVLGHRRNSSDRF